MSTIGFIGGSGIYEALPLSDVREVTYETPYGPPSDAVTIGEFADTGRSRSFLDTGAITALRQPTSRTARICTRSSSRA